MRLEIARVEFNLVWIIRSEIVSRLLKFAWYISFSILCYHIFISGSQICVKLGLDTNSTKVFMAAQPSKDGRLGGSPQNSYAGRHPEKRFVQGEHRIPSVSNSPEGRRADGE